MIVRDAYSNAAHPICRSHLQAAQAGDHDPGYALGPVQSARHADALDCESCSPEQRAAKADLLWRRNPHGRWAEDAREPIETETIHDAIRATVDNEPRGALTVQTICHALRGQVFCGDVADGDRVKRAIGQMVSSGVLEMDRCEGLSLLDREVWLR